VAPAGVELGLRLLALRLATFVTMRRIGVTAAALATAAWLALAGPRVSRRFVMCG
jgi:hypothetical protein